MDLLTNAHTTPFLRWTGSKRWFTKEFINDFLPKNFNNYHELFLGGGSVFFYIKSVSNYDRKYYLSDSNEELINAYLQLRDSPSVVIGYLKNFLNTEKEYYKIRSLKPRSSEKRAARFIYLNRTSFNGIYRVNSKGLYNVPYGRRSNVDIVSENLIIKINALLSEVNIMTANFSACLENIEEGDLVFLDPPYTVAHENNGFIEYNQNLFSWSDQEKLQEFILQIIEKKAYFILTNASHQSIFKLYENIGNISKLSRYSKVGGRNKTRGNYNELIIYNTK
ncbi:DNA adenine methylase [Pedobacter psychrotolerans]|uniref:DNA adenine methylase n=1 Tax=Pedobacter psychrotolerans TaxID=1843235 RepID=UPI003F9B4AE4